MMPVCGYKTLFGRCGRTAESNIGRIVLLGEVDGFGKPWEQTHYLCHKHHQKLLKALGYQAGASV